MFIKPSQVLAWPPANHIDPERHGPADVIIDCILLALVTALLVIRIYTRRVISRNIGWDDYFILAAYLPAVAYTSIGFYGHFNLDWTLHVWDTRLEKGVTSLQISLAAQIVFALATGLTKMSTLALTYRLTSASQSRIRYVVLAVAIVTALDTVIFIFVTLFSCSPISEFWTLSLEPQNCIDAGAHLVAGSVINTVTDLIIVLLPVPMVARLNLPPKQRIIVGLLFAGGILASIAGAVRTYVTFLFIDSPDADLTFYAYYVLLAGVIELYVGIICASVPATKPFFSRYLPQLIHSIPGPQGTTKQGRKTGISRNSASILIINDTASDTSSIPASPEKAARADLDLNKPLPKSPRPF